MRPKLGIIMLADNGLSYTKRAVQSVLEHTDLSFDLVVVDNRSPDGTQEWLRSNSDPRVKLIRCSENHGVSRGRNIGLDALSGDEDFIVFLDNDIEVLARWWEPYVSALQKNNEAGIAGQEGRLIKWEEETYQLIPITSEEIRSCDSVAGHCMFVRARTLELVGRFDERLGPLSHGDRDLAIENHDFAMRANRIGEEVLSVPAGGVVHFKENTSRTETGVRSSQNTSKVSEQQNTRSLAVKHARQQVHSVTPFLILADLNEVLEYPELLRTYVRTFTKNDEAGLLLYGPGVDERDFQDKFGKITASFGINIDQSPKIIAMLPANAEQDHEMTLSDEVYGMLSMHRPIGQFQQLAWLKVNDTNRLRFLAAKAWKARPIPTKYFESTGRNPEHLHIDDDASGDNTHLVKLNLGAGDLRVPGFLSVDLREDIADVVADVTDLPYADDSVEEILAFDLLEHFPADRTQQILKEWKRVLVTGGCLTLKVPNLQALGRMIHDDGDSTTTFIRNVYGGHRYGPEGAWDTHHNGWTPRLLRDELAFAGFHLISNDLEPNMTAKALKMPG